MDIACALCEATCCLAACKPGSVLPVKLRGGRCRVQVYHSMAQAAQGIMKDKGFRGLYRGVHVTLLEIIPYAALQFGLYDAFTSAYTKARHSITHPVQPQSAALLMSFYSTLANAL